MDFEHTLLLLLFILPLAYKIAFWKEIFSGEGNKKQKLFLGYSHFWTYIEFPLFFGSLFVYFNPNLEIFFFNFLLYLFALMHIFLIGKLVRRQNVFGKEPYFHISLSFLIAGVCFFLGDFWNSLGIYGLMSFSYIFFALIFGYKNAPRDRYQGDHFGK